MMKSIIWSILWTVCLVSLFKCDPLTKQENTQRLSICGTKITSKVYQGTPAAQSEAPWSVFLKYHKNPPLYGTCTGTVVSSRHILTATHCFAEISETGWINKTKGFDKKNCKDGNYIMEDPNHLKQVQILSDGKVIAKNPKRITLVRGCVEKTGQTMEEALFYSDDYAIIDLGEDLTFGNTIHPVCVAKDTGDNVGDASMEYYGFGIDPSQTPINAGTLRHETIQIRADLIDMFPSRDKFVANDPNGKTIACQGDSGGGAIMTIDGKTTIAGVLSQTSCADETKRTGKEAMEMYAAVGFYADTTCKLTGICEDRDYDTYHQGYTRQLKHRLARAVHDE